MSFYADRWWRDNKTAQTTLARLDERVNGEAEARSRLAARVYDSEGLIEALQADLAQTADDLAETLVERTDRLAQTMGALAASHVELMRQVAALQRPSLDRRILARARTYVGKT